MSLVKNFTVISITRRIEIELDCGHTFIITNNDDSTIKKMQTAIDIVCPTCRKEQS